LQHAFIPDALSGYRLNTLTQCVPIGVEGHDADGKPLAVRDARSLCVLLQGLHASASPCALLTAGPAAGKTWLMSQLIMHSIDGDLLPILVEVQRLQKALAEHEAAFAAAPDWVDAYLRLTCKPDHYDLLRAAMDARRALVLLDGLDEAGRERARIEAAIPKGARVVALDERGEGLGTQALARRLTLWQEQGDVALLIGGPDGLDPALRAAAHERIRLSDLTLPHAFARVLLIEQLYRAWSINAKHPYHRE
jgi:23S rRNA (pseudouridine1915-N3)-methyltransferase